MTKKDVLELFKFLKAVYPNFEIDQHMIDTWAELLKEQNNDEVMRNAKRHALESKFPPTVADIASQSHSMYIPSADKFIAKYERWKREAKYANS